jgi:hypothetical protein
VGYVRPHIRNGHRVRGHYRRNPRTSSGIGATLFAIFIALIVLYALAHGQV